MRQFFIFTISLFFSIAAQADEIARTVIDGKAISIQADGTWQYVDQNSDSSPLAKVKNPENCNHLDGNISFCPTPSRLTISPGKPPHFAALYVSKDSFYVGFLIEKLGKNQNFSVALVKKAALMAAAG